MARDEGGGPAGAEADGAPGRGALEFGTRGC
jgi:hypothetical protein